eukprot:558593-Rhodomonas_salina.3
MHPPVSRRTECSQGRRLSGVLWVRTATVASVSWNSAQLKTSCQLINCLGAAMYVELCGSDRVASILPSVYCKSGIVSRLIGLGSTYLLSFVPENPRACPLPSARSQGLAEML